MHRFLLQYSIFRGKHFPGAAYRQGIGGHAGRLQPAAVHLLRLRPGLPPEHFLH